MRTPKSNERAARRTRRRRLREWPTALTWEDKLSDRLNPVLVRDLQQSMHGPMVRAAIAGVGALLTVRMFQLMSSDRGSVIGASTEARFMAAGQLMLGDLLGLLLLAIVVVVPLRAFLSMRDEVAKSATEQLTLSDLGSTSVFRAKLGSSLVLDAVFVGMFAPLFALVCALRAVGVGELFGVLWLTVLLSVASTCLALAAATLCRVDGARNLMLGVVGGGLTLAAVGLYGAQNAWWSTVEYGVRNAALALWFGPLIPASVAVALGAITCTSAFDHVDANRSTRVRLLAFAMLGAALAVGWLVDLRSVEIGTGVVLAAMPFCWFAVTEPERMTRIVRTRESEAGLLRAPFLPGRGRGMLFSLLALGVADLVGWALTPPRGHVEAVHVCALYGLIVTVAGLWVRAVNSTGVARVVVFSGVLVAALVPLCHNAAAGRSLGAWTPTEFVSPVATVWRAQVHGVSTTVLVVLGVVALLAVVTTVPTIARGLRELREPVEEDA